jgi:hypothetical protein
MGIPTLISTATASNAASVSITSGIDSTYDEYMFVFTDINPATNSTNLLFNGSTDSGSNYNVAKTSTIFDATHPEDNSKAVLSYIAGWDGDGSHTDFQVIAGGLNSDADSGSSGTLFLFSPSNTTYVKHWHSTISLMHADPGNSLDLAGGYFNTTSAIDAVQFKMSSGNMDGVIQLFGIS